MKKELLRDDYYNAVNGKWIDEAQIPGDKPAMSAFLELHLGIEELLLKLASEWEENQDGLSDHLKEFVKLYKMAKDFDKREELGIKPINIILDRINNLNNLADLETNFKDLTVGSISLPFDFGVTPDFMNSNNQILYFGEASLILPDSSYYYNEQQKAQMLGLWQATTMQVLNLYGYKEEDAAKLIQNTLAFDNLLLPTAKSSVEKADYVKMYNPLDRDEITNKVKNVNLVKIADLLVNEKIDNVIFTNIKFVDEFDNIINDNNFALIKDWILVNNLLKFTNSLTEDLRVAGGAFGRALSGIQEAQAKEKSAFNYAYGYFGQAVGLHYGLNYFGPKAKEDVTHMVHEMIEVYKERIRDNEWLEEATKEKAISKVNKLSVLVGYPDELPKYYDLMKISSYEEGSNLLLERLKVNELLTLDNYSKYNKAPNKNLWQMPASMVNAYYSPQNNQIVFPAAILQRPYYSLDQSPSENYGGIGAVMAHEISHAFDNNGAKFDENGSLNNWWTDNDLKAFEAKSAEMIALFDGLETGYGKCNGELTVSENIADSGGLRAALEASKKDKDHNIELFFKNWARVWRQKSHEKYAQLLLTVDVHGPAILRANMQLSNLEEFQDFYKLKEEDKMYLAKDKMVKIW